MRGIAHIIASRIAEEHSISIHDITGPRQTANIFRARAEAMWVVQKITNASSAEIGAWFRREASTVRHALRRAEQEMQRDADLMGHLWETVLRFHEPDEKPVFKSVRAA